MAMKPAVLLMDEPYAALDALTRRKMQDELLQLWDDIRFTVVFVTHSIEEAAIVGSRILVLSPHPGQVRAELNSPGFALDARSGVAFHALVQKYRRHAVWRQQPHRALKETDNDRGFAAFAADPSEYERDRLHAGNDRRC